MTIFPEPQISELTGAQLLIKSGAKIVTGTNATELERYAVSLAEKALGSGGSIPVIIGTPESNSEISPAILARLNDVPNSDQGYVISVTAQDIVLAGKSPVAVLYAVQTLLQMLEHDGDEIIVPEGRITDWPERKYRGIFAESRWCSELMTLQDWKDAIDLLAGLKFNVFNVGIANNWMIQYEGKRSEFFLVPIKKYPELKAPKSIEYYSAKQSDYIRAEYEPYMYTEDFFGDIVAYGMSRGITVYPHFNTPGHNSLIPHKIPEISSKDENGNPVGYGFCLSNPKTYEVMFNIVDEIVDRYLLPHGVKFFHLGLDEVWPIIGWDESEPSRVVSPFCQCPECRGKEWYDQFVDYVIALCKHLEEKGIEKINMWHDSFVRGGRMNEELTERFRKEGILDKVVLHWWRYGDFFDTIHPELGIASWVVPMTGYYYWTPLMDHLQNIYLATQKAAEENAEGAESYCNYYNAYFRNYACLAEYSWNSAGVGDIKAFRGKYTQFLFGDAPEGREAFEHFDFTTGPLAPNSWAIYYYPNAYAVTRRTAFIRANYPQAIVEQLWDNPGGVHHNLGLICQNARSAKRIFDKEELWKRNPLGLAQAYSAEMARTAASAHIFLRLAQATRAYRDMQVEGEIDLASLKACTSELDAAIKEMDEAIFLIENDIPAHMIPALLRELAMQRRFAVKYAEELGSNIKAVESGSIGSLPDLECMRTSEIRWVGKDHKDEG